MDDGSLARPGGSGSFVMLGGVVDVLRADPSAYRHCLSIRTVFGLCIMSWVGSESRNRFDRHQLRRAR